MSTADYIKQYNENKDHIFELNNPAGLTFKCKLRRPIRSSEDLARLIVESATVGL